MSYPKDGDDKVRDSNKQLRAQIKRLRKENEELRQELDNIQKPVRVRKEPVVFHEPAEKYDGLNEPAQSKDDFRKEFVKKFKPRGGKRFDEKD